MVGVAASSHRMQGTQHYSRVKGLGTMVDFITDPFGNTEDVRGKKAPRPARTPAGLTPQTSAPPPTKPQGPLGGARGWVFIALFFLSVIGLAGLVDVAGGRPFFTWTPTRPPGEVLFEEWKQNHQLENTQKLWELEQEERRRDPEGRAREILGLPPEDPTPRPRR
jgi:hypothetical protein